MISMCEIVSTFLETTNFNDFQAKCGYICAEIVRLHVHSTIPGAVGMMKIFLFQTAEFMNSVLVINLNAKIFNDHCSYV